MVEWHRSDWNMPGTSLSDIFKERAGELGFVAGGEDGPFAEVARAIDMTGEAGIERVGLITRGTTSEKNQPRSECMSLAPN